MAARSAASRLAATASRAARASGKALVAGSAAYGLYAAGGQALTESVPYGGRQRFAPPAWLESCLPDILQPVRLIACRASISSYYEIGCVRRQ